MRPSSTRSPSEAPSSAPRPASKLGAAPAVASGGALAVLSALDLVVTWVMLTRELGTGLFAALLLGRAALALAGSFPQLVLAPPAVKEARRSFVPFAALFHFFVPVVGFAGMALVLRAGLAGRSAAEATPWQTFAFEEDVGARTATIRHRASSPAKLADILRTRSPQTAEKRFQAVLQTRHLPLKQGISMLKMALKDPSDEVRLYAFSRLERLRNDLETQTRELTEMLGGAPEDGKALVHLRLAEAYWEIAYLGLAEGAVLAHALKEAHAHAAAACKLRPESAPAEFLMGRVLLHQREYSWALAAFERAIYAGYARTKALPYMAECAFRQRRYAVVRTMLRELDASGREALGFQSVVEFWQ